MDGIPRRDEVLDLVKEGMLNPHRDVVVRGAELVRLNHRQPGVKCEMCTQVASSYPLYIDGGMCRALAVLWAHLNFNRVKKARLVDIYRTSREITNLGLSINKLKHWDMVECTRDKDTSGRQSVVRLRVPGVEFLEGKSVDEYSWIFADKIDWYEMRRTGYKIPKTTFQDVTGAPWDPGFDYRAWNALEKRYEQWVSSMGGS